MYAEMRESEKEIHLSIAETFTFYCDDSCLEFVKCISVRHCLIENIFVVAAAESASVGLYVYTVQRVHCIDTNRSEYGERKGKIYINNNS